MQESVKADGYSWDASCQRYPATTCGSYSATRGFTCSTAAPTTRSDLAAWTAAFRRRVDQIVNVGPCPDVNGVAD